MLTNHMLYVPYHGDENVFSELYLSWKNAYFLFEKTMKCNEKKFTNKTMTKWNNIDSIFTKLENNCLKEICPLVTKWKMKIIIKDMVSNHIYNSCERLKMKNKLL